MSFKKERAKRNVYASKVQNRYHIAPSRVARTVVNAVAVPNTTPELRPADLTRAIQYLRILDYKSPLLIISGAKEILSLHFPESDYIEVWNNILYKEELTHH